MRYVIRSPGWRMFWRTCAAAAASAVVLAACRGRSGAAGDAPITLELGLPTDVTSFANADIVVAEDQGLFRAVGLNVHVKNLSSGVTVIQGVVGGALHIGAASIEPVVNANAQGAEIAIIGSYADRLTVSMVTPSTIQAARDLRGKRLGIQQVGAFREVMTRMVLADAGLAPSDVSYVPVTATGYTSALVQGTIQSAILQQEQAIDVLAGNGGGNGAGSEPGPALHVLVDLGQLRPEYFYGTYVASRAWLATHEDAAKRFLTAIVRAHRFMYQDRTTTVRIVARATGMSEAVIGRAYDVLLGNHGVFAVNAGLEPARITRTVQTMQQFKILTAAAPGEALGDSFVASLVDRGPISAVIADLGAWTGDPRWR